MNHPAIFLLSLAALLITTSPAAAQRVASGESLVAEAKHGAVIELAEGTYRLTGLWDDKAGQYTTLSKGAPAAKYDLLADKPPELSDQLDQVVQTVKGALPSILALTNELTHVLTNAANATALLNELLTSASPP